MAKQNQRPGKKKYIDWQNIVSAFSPVDYLEKAAIKLAAPLGLSAYSNYMGLENLPVNQRFYVQALTGSAPKFTENDLTPEEQFDLQNTVLNQYYDPNRLSSVKDKQLEPFGTYIPFTYDDYQTANLGRTNQKKLAIEGSNPETNLASTLGMFLYTVDPSTNDVVIKDTYDFNDRGMSQGKILHNFNEELLDAAVVDPIFKWQFDKKKGYDLARLLGSIVLPAESGKGVPVNIRLSGMRPALEDPNRPGYEPRPINPALDVR